MKRIFTGDALNKSWPALALAGIVLIAEGIGLVRGNDVSKAVTDVPVSATRVVCPVSQTSKAAGELTFAGIPTPDAQVSNGDDAIFASPLVPEESEQELVIPNFTTVVTGDGGISSNPIAQGSVPVVVEGSGRLAATATAVIASTARSGDDRGLATASCGPATTSWWFVGGQSTLGRLTRIVITNPDLAPATFDVSIYDGEGLVDAPAGRGLSVAAQSRLELRLDALAPDTAAAAFHIQTSSGRVHAAVLIRGVDGLTPLGSEWLPATTPATRVVIPIPAGLRNIDAYVMAQREIPSEFSILVRTPAGVFTPAGAEGLTLAADSLLSVPMDDALAEGGALEIISNVGIVAGVTATKSGSGLSDYVAFGSVPAIKGLALTSGLRTGAKHSLVLASWDDPSTVTITTISADGTRQSQDIVVGTEQVTEISLQPTSGPASVLINASSGISASLTSVIQASEGVLATSVTMERRATSVQAPKARISVGIERRGSDTN